MDPNISISLKYVGLVFLSQVAIKTSRSTSIPAFSWFVTWFVFQHALSSQDTFGEVTWYMWFALNHTFLDNKTMICSNIWNSLQRLSWSLFTLQDCHSQWSTPLVPNYSYECHLWVVVVGKFECLCANEYPFFGVKKYVNVLLFVENGIR